MMGGQPFHNSGNPWLFRLRWSKYKVETPCSAVFIGIFCLEIKNPAGFFYLIKTVIYNIDT